jgi:hypothetical protein
MKRSGLPPAEAAQVAARRRALPGGAVDDGQISIPGLQVLPVVQVDDVPATPPRRLARQASRDDATMK